MRINVIPLLNFKYGVVNIYGEEAIPRGSASASKNWLTLGDRIELRRGQQFMGTSSVNVGNGKISGIKKITDALGVEILFGTYGQKAKYYSNSTLEFVEIGSDLLGSSVVDSDGIASEPISLSIYDSLAGPQLWLNSPNCAGYYKIMAANPGDAVNQYDSTKNFKGHIKIDTSRTLLWGRIKDQSSLYGSYIDTQTYTTVTGESITGPSGTLAFKGGGSKRTCFAVTITIGAVVYTDNYAGTLTGSDGSSGTINYATGAFVVAATGAGTADYQWEDSTNHGIADFTKSATRLAGEGFLFPQAGGGILQNIGVYSSSYFCLHTAKTWALTIGSDDTTATNLPYRDRVGIPNLRAIAESGDGIYYIDDQNPDNTKVRLLTYARGGSTQVVPVPVSNNLNLSDYRFDQAAGIEWGDYVLFACRLTNSTSNDRVLVYNKDFRCWDILDYNVACFEIFNGALIAGDSVTNNFITLFSGFDDLESLIDNYWIGNLDLLNYDGLKKCRKFYVRGLIMPDQDLQIWISVDNGNFVLYDTIEGDSSYVDSGQAVDIGATTLGQKVIGGGSGGNVAYPYEKLIKLRGLDKFERIQVKYVATGLGYVSVQPHKFWDVRYSYKKVPAQYRGS